MGSLFVRGFHSIEGGAIIRQMRKSKLRVTMVRVHKERDKTIRKIIVFMVLKETLENYFTSPSHRLLTYKTREPN